jgi:hypothetical protein
MDTVQAGMEQEDIGQADMETEDLTITAGSVTNPRENSPLATLQTMGPTSHQHL